MSKEEVTVNQPGSFEVVDGNTRTTVETEGLIKDEGEQEFTGGLFEDELMTILQATKGQMSDIIDSTTQMSQEEFFNRALLLCAMTTAHVIQKNYSTIVKPDVT